MKIGHIDLGHKPLLLAPMEDVTDYSFRYMCKKFGAAMVYTEFVSSEALIRNVKSCISKMHLNDFERPAGIQIYGENIDSMVEAARIAESMNPNLIDINFGCPMKKIAGRGAGSGMMRDVPKMIEMTRKIIEVTHLPVTVKTRLGWDEQSLNIEEIVEKLQDVGVQAITIHGRTRCQMYKGDADWSLIGKIKQNQRITIPIIGNGDVKTPERAKNNFEKYSVDGIMIGRASYGYPWIFRDIRHYLDHDKFAPELTIADKVEIARTHFRKSVEVKGETVGIYEMRRHFSCYFKSLPDFKPMRLRLVTSMEVDEIEEILNSITNTYS